jgi:hypothetical protein
MRVDLSISEVRVGDVFCGAPYGIDDAVIDRLTDDDGSNIHVIIRDGRASVTRKFGRRNMIDITVIKNGKPVWGKLFAGTTLPIDR